MAGKYSDFKMFHFNYKFQKQNLQIGGKVLRFENVKFKFTSFSNEELCEDKKWFLKFEKLVFEFFVSFDSVILLRSRWELIRSSITVSQSVSHAARVFPKRHPST